MPFLHIGPCKQILKNVSEYSSRFHMNVQLPSTKTRSLHNSFFLKGSKLWNSLPTALHNLSSREFRTKVIGLFLSKKLMFGIYTVAILTQLPSCVCFV